MFWCVVFQNYVDLCGHYGVNYPIEGQHPIHPTSVHPLTGHMVTSLAVKPVGQFTVALLGTDKGQLVKVREIPERLVITGVRPQLHFWKCLRWMKCLKIRTRSCWFANNSSLSSHLARMDPTRCWMAVMWINLYKCILQFFVLASTTFSIVNNTGYVKTMYYVLGEHCQYRG